MKTRYSIAAAIALFVIAPLTVSNAQTTGTKCTDGTTSTAVGKGACSGHGGIKTATPPAKTAPAPSSKAATKTTPKPDSKAAPSKTKTDAKTPAKTAASKTTPTKTPSAAKTAPTKTPPAAKTAPTKGDASNKDPKDATALCKDGTYSHAATHTGACSGHGGVDKFLKP